MKELIKELAELHQWYNIPAYKALEAILNELDSEITINDTANFGSLRATYTSPVMTSVRIIPTIGSFNIQVRSEPIMLMVVLPTIEVQNA